MSKYPQPSKAALQPSPQICAVMRRMHTGRNDITGNNAGACSGSLSGGAKTSCRITSPSKMSFGCLMN
jgi:hypothetical protein